MISSQYHRKVKVLRGAVEALSSQCSKSIHVPQNLDNHQHNSQFAWKDGSNRSQGSCVDCTERVDRRPLSRRYRAVRLEKQTSCSGSRCYNRSHVQLTFGLEETRLLASIVFVFFLDARQSCRQMLCVHCQNDRHRHEKH
jgi:hypothetical protein